MLEELILLKNAKKLAKKMNCVMLGVSIRIIKTKNVNLFLKSKKLNQNQILYLAIRTALQIATVECQIEPQG